MKQCNKCGFKLFNTSYFVVRVAVKPPHCRKRWAETGIYYCEDCGEGEKTSFDPYKGDSYPC